MKRFLENRIWVLAAFLISTAACSIDSPDPISIEKSDQQKMSQSTGTLLAEYRPSQSWSGQRAKDGKLHVSGQFFRIKGADPREAMAALDVWQPDWDLAPDGCSVLERRERDKNSNESVRMRFLDVGEIEVAGPTESFNLIPRQLPFVTTNFSGVIYGTNIDSRHYPGLLPGNTYQFSASGSRDVAEFTVSLEVPSQPNLHLATESGEWSEHRYVPVSEDELNIQWESSDFQHGSLFLDFKSSDKRMKCRLKDDGQFRVPIELLEKMSEDDQKKIYLKLRRVQSKVVDIDGLANSEFIFSTTEKMTISLR